MVKLSLPSGNAFWDVFGHRYAIHVVVIALGLLVVTNNLQARLAGFRDEDIGKQSILYTIVSGSEYTFVEETADERTVAAPAYWPGGTDGTAVSSSFGVGEEIDTTSLTEGGAAIVKPELSPSDEDVTPRGTVETYVVQPGDTIGTIAERFGVSVTTILWENNLTERSYIRPGDKLTILPGTGISYKVKRGDTIAKVAKLYNVSVDDIILYNDLIDETAVSIGQTLFIPGGKKLAAPVAAPTVSSTVRSYVGSVPSSATPTSDTTLQWPTTARRITQYFSWRHTGVDIADRSSPPIFAAESGTVVRAERSGYNGGYGRMIIINHEGGLQTLYGHLNQLFVSVGDTVTRGQTIGIMGNTGRSTGPHLHFEVRSGGKRLNPLGYVR